jgi:hypothetical protein
MQKIYDTAVELNEKTGINLAEAMRIVLASQKNKLLEKQNELLSKISEKLEPTDILRYIN